MWFSPDRQWSYMTCSIEVTSYFCFFQDYKNFHEKNAYRWQTDNPEDNYFCYSQCSYLITISSKNFPIVYQGPHLGVGMTIASCPRMFQSLTRFCPWCIWCTWFALANRFRGICCKEILKCITEQIVNFIHSR